MQPVDEIKNMALPYLAALLVLKKSSEFKQEILRCLDTGINIHEIQETIIQTYLFDGYPAALEGLITLRKTIGDKYESQPAEPITENSMKEWILRGESTCRKIYSSNFEKLMKNVKDLSPDLANWMLWEGYGKVLSRGSLDLKTRELINVAILAVKDYPRQLHSHLKGALNVGVKSELVDTLFLKIDNLSPERIEKARDFWTRIKKENYGDNNKRS